MSFFLNILGIWWGLPSWEGWAPDEIIPKDVLLGISDLFSGNWYDTYPPFHFYLLAVLYLPLNLPAIIWRELGFIDFSGVLVDNSTTNIFHLTYQISYFVGRIVSVLMGTGTVLVVYLCGREISPKQESLLTALIVSLLTPFVYYSKIINVEVPYVFWFCLSLLFYIRILKAHRLTDYLLFSAAAVLSICTKDQAYGLYVLTAPYILISKCIHDRRTLRVGWLQSLTDRKVLYSTALSVILFCAIHNILFNYSGFLSHVQLLIGPASYDSADFFTRDDNNWSQHWQLLLQSLRNVQFSFTLPVFGICLAGLVMSLFKVYRNGFGRDINNYCKLSLLVPVISYYLFFVSVILYSRTRFLIPVCIILAFFGAQFISDVLLSRKRYLTYKVLGRSFVFILFFYMFVQAFSVDIVMINDARYVTEKEMDLTIPKTSYVLGIGDVEYLPRFEYRGFDAYETTHRLSEEEIDAGIYDYIITTSAYDILERHKQYKSKSTTYKMVDKIVNGDTQYQVFYQNSYQPKWNLLNFEGVSSNLDKINPEIIIYVHSRNITNAYNEPELSGLISSMPMNDIGSMMGVLSGQDNKQT
ncbi:dolichyl-phosphate-mannose-protein mannosyltransferase [Leptolyngbya sp. Heron Island J]|nr:dolichyl-phosphate-mannose-protein mannosyltransferase [Leptolyngbya sp. Heron Island J]